MAQAVQEAQVFVCEAMRSVRCGQARKQYLFTYMRTRVQCQGHPVLLRCNLLYLQLELDVQL